MKAWIVALIITVVVFTAIQLFWKQKDNRTSELPNQVATFCAVFLVSIVVCYWFESGNVYEAKIGGANIGGENIESDMLKTINEEIKVGLPPF